jgi:hypothetical protein
MKFYFMNITDLILNIVGGGLLGSLGQGIRIVVGLKKLNAENVSKTLQGKSTEDFSAGRLLMSIFIGFVAGALGLLTKTSLAKDGSYNGESIVTIIAIGYSGADFIEGVFNTYLDKFKSETPPAKIPIHPGGPMQNPNMQPLNVSDEANFNSYQFQG